VQYWEKGDGATGTARVLDGIALARQLAADDPAYQETFGEWIIAPASTYLAASGRLDESVTLLQEAVGVFEKLERAEPTSHRHRYDHANALINLGQRTWDKGDHPTGTARVLDGLKVARQLYADDLTYGDTFGEWLLRPGTYLTDRPQAITLAQEAVSVYTKLNSTDPAYGPKLAAAKARLAELQK
jgi:hypothetical protein